MISVVIPVRNEAENIIPLIEEIHGALDGPWDFEVIYVDDGSSDETKARLTDAGTRFERLKVLRHRASCGQSAAIWTGVKAAQGRWIVTLDGDGQNDPADIPALLEVAEAAESGAPLDMVAGIRRKRRDSWLKRVSSRIANRVRSGLLGDNVTDTGCGLKVIRRETYLALPYFDHMHRYLPALILRAGGRLECVDVNHRPRHAGRSNYATLDRLGVGIADLMGVMWLKRRNKIPIIESEE
jgi:dolichol-phosphate mannosyltransferase